MTLKQIQSLIKWLRAEKISYSTISAGGVTLDGVIDGKAESPPEPKPEPRLTAEQRYGGILLQQPSTKQKDTIPDEAIVDD